MSRIEDACRVAYVIGELGKGGAEFQLHELVRQLDPRAFTARVFALSEGGYWADALRGLGVPVQAFPRRGSADVVRLVSLRRALRAYAPRILHTVLWSGNVYGRVAALGLDIAVRIAAERNTIVRPRWQVWIERALDRSTDAYLVNCRAIADVLVQHEGLAAEKMRVIPNGVDLARFPPFTLERAAGRQAVGFDPSRRLVALVGRLEPQKDIATFLGAVAQIAPEEPDVDFLVVGEGAERARLEAHAATLGVGGRVRFLGLRHDVPALLAGVDVLALTSTYEGFPNVVLEGMSTGAVAVATDVGGCREVVTDGATGILVPARAPDAVAAAVRRVLRNHDYARGLALAARRRVEDEFTVEVMAARTTDVYRTLLQGGAPAVVAA